MTADDLTTTTTKENSNMIGNVTTEGRVLLDAPKWDDYRFHPDREDGFGDGRNRKFLFDEATRQFELRRYRVKAAVGQSCSKCGAVATTRRFVGSGQKSEGTDHRWLADKATEYGFSMLCDFTNALLDNHADYCSAHAKEMKTLTDDEFVTHYTLARTVCETAHLAWKASARVEHFANHYGGGVEFFTGPDGTMSPAQEAAAERHLDEMMSKADAKAEAAHERAAGIDTEAQEAKIAAKYDFEDGGLPYHLGGVPDNEIVRW